MIKEIKIGKKLIGVNRPVFIIAEAGVNHNGNLKTAFKLIDAAVIAGADAVKFQTFISEDVVTSAGKMVGYQLKNIGKSMSQLEMIKCFELKEDYWGLIANYCIKRNIMFLSTPHGGFHSVDLLQSLNVPAFKFGSGDLTNLPLLRYAAKFDKPIIISTGMATLAEIEDSINTMKNAGNNKIIVLHCTTNYPCPWDEVNLNAMLTMRDTLSILVGYSDHTRGIQVPIMATTLGACLIEKHFTLDRNMKGPDHKASLEPEELKDMIDSIRNISIILGSKTKKPNASEVIISKNVRKSLVAARDIKKGENFNEQNLAIKRPGTGVAPKYFDQIIGHIAKRNIRYDSQIKKNDF